MLIVFVIKVQSTLSCSAWGFNEVNAENFMKLLYVISGHVLHSGRGTTYRLENMKYNYQRQNPIGNPVISGFSGQNFGPEQF